MTVYDAYHGLIALVAVCTTASNHYSVLQWEFFAHLRVTIFLLYTSCNGLYTCECRVAENSVLALVFGEDSGPETRLECGKYTTVTHAKIILTPQITCVTVLTHNYYFTYCVNGPFSPFLLTCCAWHCACVWIQSVLCTYVGICTHAYAQLACFSSRMLTVPFWWQTAARNGMPPPTLHSLLFQNWQHHDSSNHEQCC